VAKPILKLRVIHLQDRATSMRERCGGDRLVTVERCA